MKKPDWNTTTNARRKRQMVTITLGDDARDALERLAKVHGGRSQAIEALILAAAK